MKKKKRVRAVLVSRRNWEEGTEIPHTLPVPTHAQPPAPRYQHHTTERYMFYQEAPAGGRRHHSSSTACLSSHSWCYTHCGFGRRYRQSYPSFQYHTEYSRRPKNPAFPSTPPSHQHWFFKKIFSIVLPFSECHAVGITRDTARSDGFLHLATCIRGSSASAYGDSSRLFRTE